MSEPQEHPENEIENEEELETQMDGAEEHDPMQALQQQLDETKDQLLRTLAESENIRRRARQEKEDASKYAVSGFARDLLAVADNLRRALESIPEDLLEGEPRLTNLTGGIEATERELLKTFEKNGIKQLNPEGEIFDPNFHEVMFETPMPGKPAGTIIQVMELGYTLGGRLIRPARVGVVKDDGPSAPSGETPPTGGTIDTQA